MKPPPRSIFTGRRANPGAAEAPESRRLSTPEYHEALNTGSASTPSTPLEYPQTRPVPAPSWPLKSPSVPGDNSAGWQPRDLGALKTPPATAVAGRKRASGIHDDAAASRSDPRTPASEPLLKRRRVSRSRHSLDHFPSRSDAALLTDGEQPPSPLFFSHSRRARPHLPARFSSSEAAARMLSKTRNEESGIKTVTLPRGYYSGLSPPGPTSAASGRSSERSSLPRTTTSPDGRDRNDPLRMLGSVGVVELLEQDTRPTFVVDIGDSTQYASGTSSLHILFANSALRSTSSTWELVAGRPSDVSPDELGAHASSQFRGWLLSTVIQGESLDLNPPPVEHGGIVWSCYTLRKRLRVVSGAAPTSAVSSIPSTSASNDFGIPSSSSRASASRMDISITPAQEPEDYFGGAPVPTVAEHVEQGAPSQASLADQIQPQTSDILAGPFSKADKLELPSLEGHPSFTNECVLRAHAAGDIDAFHRPRSPSPSREHDVGFFDWTRLSLSSSLPRHIQFARSIDWASTPLGPIELWSNDLRAMCNLIMSVPNM
jgi:hypothetical protein